VPSSFFKEVSRVIDGQTNVASARFGSGSVDGLGRELGRFVVATMDIPWRVTRDRLGSTPAEVVMVETMEHDVVDRRVAALPECDTIVGVGGGQAIDFAKYAAWKRGCRLVSIPTVISVDAFVTPKAAVRKNHRVEYVGDSSPDPLVLDYDLIRTAPPELNIAGAGDLLSIHTACFDWELAHAAGRDAHPFSPHDIAQARAVLDGVAANADAIRQVTDDGLRTIVEGYMRLNTICLPTGHWRVEEGSEHFLFYELEERTARPFIHGHIVGLGIYIMSRLQQNAPERITQLMDGLDLHYHPAAVDIDRRTLTDSLRTVKQYVRACDMWYTVIDDRDITDAWIDETLAHLNFA